jgi:hypothetical protein
MELYDYVSPTSSTLYYGQSFDVSTNLLNAGTGTFSGDYCAAAFDVDDNFVDYVQVLSNYTLESGFVYTNGLTFSTAAMYGLLPGTYRIGIFYRPVGGNWVQVANSGSYMNMVQVTVVNPNTIALNSSMVVTPGPTLVQGGQVSVNLNIVNNGSSTFIGDYGVGLYNLDGSLAQEVGGVSEGEGLPPDYTYLAPFLTFGPANVTVQPGTYLLAVQHNPGNGWQLTGTGAFNNPITVTVVAPGIVPDSYEVNNTVAQSYTLPVGFSGNTAAVNTTGSNLHQTSDLDHYKLELSSGFGYEISARLHDSYNSGNGNSYTADCLFSWSTDGSTWSSAFDDVMADPVTLGNGGTLHFRVAPYFAGETGTYLLQLNLTRGEVVGMAEAADLNELRIFPNPVADLLKIELEGSERVERALIFNVQGQVVAEFPNTDRSRIQVVDVSELAVGTYALQITTDARSYSQRLIIAR